MKTVSALANQERLAAGQDVFWLFDVEWPDGPRVYSSRPLTLGQTACAPWLMQFSRRSDEPREAWPPRETPGERLTVRLSNVEGGEDRMEALARRYEAEGLDCRLRLYLQDREGAATESDCIDIFAGRITAIRLATTWAEFDAVDFVRAATARTIGRILNASRIPNLARETEVLTAPWIFGRVLGARMLPLNATPTTRLRAWMHPRSAVVPVVSLDGFPSSGTVQVGEEFIVYSSVDTQALTFGTLLDPVQRVDPTPKKAGGLVRLVLEEGFRFLLADHPCLSVAAVKADGDDVSDEDYSAETAEIGGRIAQTVTFPAWPTRLSTAPATRLLLHGYKMQTYWSAGDDNTAYEPLRAVDDWPQNTFAAVLDEMPLLSLEFRPSLGETAERYGEMTGARLVITHRSWDPWSPQSVFTVRVSKDSWEVQATLSAPLSESGVTRQTLDVSSIVQNYTDWGFLKNNPIVVQVEKSGPVNADQVHILDLAWEIDHEAYSERRMAEAITATVEGLAVDQILVENPADIVELLLTHEDLGGLAAERIDAASFAQTASELSARGYQFAARVDKPESLEALLAAALFESRAALSISGNLARLSLAPDRPELNANAEALDESVALDEELERQRARRSLPACNEVSILYAPNYAKRGVERFQSSVIERQAESNDALLRAAQVIETRWLQGDGAAARDLAVHRLTRRAARPWLAATQTPLRTLRLDRLDAVSLSRAAASLHAVPGLLIRWSQDSPDRMTLGVELPSQRMTVWEAAPGTRVEQSADCARLWIWVAGTEAAQVSLEGLLAIRGQAVEQALDSIALEAPIAYDAPSGRLYFGIGAEGTYKAALALTTEGDLLLRGGLTEFQDLSAVEMADWVLVSRTGLDWARAGDAPSFGMTLPLGD